MSPSVDFPGFDGFLGTRASLMVDFVFVAMFLVIAVMGWSIYQVRYRRRFSLHKSVQLWLAGILFVTVVMFEVEIRLHGWESRAAGVMGGTAKPIVWQTLYIHLVFAISSALLWPVVIYRAMRQFPSPPKGSQHSRAHIFWARLAAIDMTLTSITGWIFYYFAFV